MYTSIIVGINLLPLAGVLFMKWDAYEMLCFYWVESVIIGIYALPKIFLGRDDVYKKLKSLFIYMWYIGLSYFSTLFIVFVIMLNPRKDLLALRADSSQYIQTQWFSVWFIYKSLPGTLWAVLMMIVGHGLSFYNYLLKKEYLWIGSDKVLLQPFLRVILLYGVITGEIAAGVYVSPILILCALIPLKTLSELFLYRRERAACTDTAWDSGIDKMNEPAAPSRL